jgi:16S rRNA (cytidine1402-2'-O)-methyltransferase
MVVNEHTEHDAIDAVAELVADGHVVALISDAGTPAISDPGERLVRALVERSLPVWCAPGPAALIAAVIVSGFPTHRFVFEGFLPRDGAERRERLAEVARERRTCVLYEAPHRIERTLTDLAEACGPSRLVCLGRELTKMHEELWRGTLAEAIERTSTTEPRGEFVLVLEGTTVVTVDTTDADIVKALNERRGLGLSTRDSVDEVSTVLNVSRKRVYDLATSTADPGAKGPKKRKT